MLPVPVGLIGLALLLLLACNNDSAPSSTATAATRIPTSTATPTPVVVSAPENPTATPTAQPSSEDYCNIVPSVAAPLPSTPMPSPTPEVEPTRTPPPDWDPAAFDVLWDALTSASAAGGGFAFDAEMTLSGLVDGAWVRYEATLDGVSQDGQPYTRLNVAAASPDRMFEAEVITAMGQLYVREPRASSWMRLWEDRHPYVVDIGGILLPHNTGTISNSTLEGREEFGGTEVHVISGRVHYGFREASGSLDVTYRVGTGDGLLRQVSAAGEVSVAQIYRDLEIFGEVVDRDAETGRQTVRVELAAELSDFGRDVEFGTPDMLLGLFGHQSFLLPDGRVLALGGYTGGGNNNVIISFPNILSQTYDPATGFWSIDAQLAQGIQTGSAEAAYSTPFGVLPHATEVGEACLLVAGIGGEDEPVTVVSTYDLVSGSTAAIPSPPRPRLLAGLASLQDGRIMLVGGFGEEIHEPEGDFSALLNALEVAGAVQLFDPSTQSWADGAPLPEPALDAALVTLYDGRLLVIGGRSIGGRESLNETQVYDPLTDTWTMASPMHHKRGDPRAALLPDGRVLVVGRDSSALGDFDQSRYISPSHQENMSERELDALFFEEAEKWQRAHAETYDPIADTWTYTSPMVVGRNLPALTPLPDGRLLVSGGQALEGEPGANGFLPDDLLASTEIFDPRTGAWSPGPDVQEPRMGHSATVLQDGSVLLVGGIGISPTSNEIIPVPFAEVISPF
ncbi:MAG: hypothetical protein F4X98_06840 [Gammaproteobacteria bacterium]|nr:hypothetical protein [Gammaproteobacteria bacterium]